MTLFEVDFQGTVGGSEAAYTPIPSLTALEGDFPSAALSRIGEHESWRKEVHRPATSTHKWWAKRLGSIFRGILTSSIADNQDDALAVYGSAARLDGITVFDPFSGSGTTLVEAVKLGANVIGWDINPVATLVQRQAVQRWDMAELERAYKLVEGSCRAEIDRIHRTSTGETALYYFWVAVARCPDCDAETRLFSSHVFSRNAYPKRVPAAQIVCPECLDIMPGRYDFEHLVCRNGHEVTRKGAVDRTQLTCPNGHVSKVLAALDGKAPRYEMYAKLVLGFDGKKRYEPIDDYDRSLYSECSTLLSEKSSDLVLPEGELENGHNTRQAIRWGFTAWKQFFNDRQLYSLGLLGAAIRDSDAGPAEREALAALFSGTLEFNNMFCSFKGEGTGAVRHMFSHHILKPERTPLEAHPWGTPASSGSFSTLFKSRLVRAHAYKTDPTDQVILDGKVCRISGLSLPTESEVINSWPAGGLHRGTVYLRTGDSSRTDLPDESVDLVITDPPYMDNVHYSELADFFHTWLCAVSPSSDYPRSATTRNSREVQSATPDGFEQAISRVWSECSRVLKPNGLIAFTFHQARITGWAALVKALADAGLVVTAVQPVKGEMVTSITKNGSEPSNLDSIVVCRKRGSVPGLTDPHSAAQLGEERLKALKADGVTVGSGDTRSVIRGYVMATYAANPTATDMDSLVSLADQLADERIKQLSREPGLSSSATSFAHVAVP